MSRKLKLRPAFLWIPGILIFALGIVTQARVTYFFRHNAFIAKHPIACSLNVDLSEHNIREISFVSPLTREFTFAFLLHTPIPEKAEQHQKEQDDFFFNPIENAVKLETFELSWRLYEENKNIAVGIISQKDLSEREQTLDIHYKFAKQTIHLKSGRNYKLTAEVTKPSKALQAFSPELLIRTWPSLFKGNPLVVWEITDTLLLVSLGSVLIILGLLKQYFSSNRPAG